MNGVQASAPKQTPLPFRVPLTASREAFAYFENAEAAVEASDRLETYVQKLNASGRYLFYSGVRRRKGPGRVAC